MELIYPFLIAFSMVFVSELGDKTQLLVLSFSNKGQTFKILLGVAIGSFFSHGLAILFGSSVHLFANQAFHYSIHWITYLSFLLIGVASLLPQKDDSVDGKKDGLIYKISHLKLNYCLIIACTSENKIFHWCKSFFVVIAFAKSKVFNIIAFAKVKVLCQTF